MVENNVNSTTPLINGNKDLEKQVVQKGALN